MAPRANHKLIEAEGQAIIQELLQERLRLAIQYTLVTVLEEEVEIFIQAALYQRTPERKSYRNGFYERDLVTTMGVIEDLPVPRTRNGFRTRLFERYQRWQAELDFVAGVSTAQVGGQLIDRFAGFPHSGRKIQSWETRKLQAR